MGSVALIFPLIFFLYSLCFLSIFFDLMGFLDSVDFCIRFVYNCLNVIIVNERLNR